MTTMDATNNMWAGIVMFVAGLFGICSNGLAVFTVYKCRHLHNSFGFLCLSHCIANFGVCFTFAAWCAPTTVWQNSALTETVEGKRVGQINFLFWNATVYSHLSISINRFICITFPLQAKKVFTPRVIGAFFCTPWAIALCHITPYFWVNDCFVYYEPLTWVWTFTEGPCVLYISTFFDFYTSMTVFVLMTFFDLSTALKLRLMNNKNASLTGTREMHAKRKMETRFFVQAICQSATFGMEILCFYVICTFAVTQWEMFISTSFAWVACHATDGFIMCLFHSGRVRENYRKRSSLAPTTTSVIIESKSKH
ncbi:hypothetical protein PRIPAC_91442 [Pristionchus pacificus]|uniref:Srx-12 n=1 Tax=Pristionchus pacificus TaxID=54126 RepID=A0A2A6CWZ6_PRIPA|nr:hypothetical protein PRIPAC_91442 [Pristionchus pacificus]|eukprot:PDM82705.1 srx-12 [Pristionchus pacificus]